MYVELAVAGELREGVLRTAGKRMRMCKRERG
jgi:hypothetical protein